MTYQIVLWLGFVVLALYVAIRRKDTARLYNSAWLAGGFLLLCLLGRLVLLGAYPGEFSSLSAGQILVCLWRGLLPDVLACLWWCGPVLLALNLPVQSVKWQKFWLSFGFVWLGVFALALAGDVIYFGFVHRHTGSDILNLFSLPSFLWQMAWLDYRGVLAGGIVCIGLAGWLGAYIAGKNGRPVKRAGVWEGAFLGMLGWICFQPFLLRPYAWIPYGYQYGVAQGHLIQNGVFTMWNHGVFKQQGYAFQKYHLPPAQAAMDPQKALETAKHFFMSSPQEQPVDPRYPLLRKRVQFNADARGRNVIILILESLQWKAIDTLAGTSTGATPHLDKLIAQGQVFNRFYSSSPDASLFGIGTILSGVCRITGFPYYGRGLETVSVSALGRLFAKEGYQTYFVQASSYKWMYIGPLARQMGFTVYSGEDLTPLLPYRSKNTVSDYEALMRLADSVQAASQPFLGVFFSLSTHEPFDAFYPLAFGNGTEKTFARQFPTDKYTRNLAYTDWAVGQFVDRLKQAGLYDNTVFILVGDHPRRGFSGSEPKEMFRVPFVLAAPGVLPPGANTRISSQADLLPTLVDLFHISQPYAAMGNSVLDKNTPGFAFISNLVGERVGLISAAGLAVEPLGGQTPGQDGLSRQRRQAAELNRAMYDLLRQGRWAPAETAGVR